MVAIVPVDGDVLRCINCRYLMMSTRLRWSNVPGASQVVMTTSAGVWSASCNHSPGYLVRVVTNPRKFVCSGFKLKEACDTMDRRPGV